MLCLPHKKLGRWLRGLGGVRRECIERYKEYMDVCMTTNDELTYASAKTLSTQEAAAKHAQENADLCKRIKELEAEAAIQKADADKLADAEET